MERTRLTQWGILIATLLTLGINSLPNALPLNGQTTGIAVKHGGTPSIATAAWIMIALVGTITIAGFVWTKRRTPALTTA